MDFFSKRRLGVCLVTLFSLSVAFASGQPVPDVRAIPNWSAPAYFAPSVAPSNSTLHLFAERGAAGERPSSAYGPLTNNGSRGRFFTPESLEIAAVVPVPFVAIAPCRQYNSLNSSPLLQGVNRVVPITGAPCNIPANAVAVSANITVFNIIGASGNGVFKVDTVSPPLSAWINYPPTEIQRANAGTLALNLSGQIIVQVAQGAGQVDFVVDVNGYYADIGSPRAYALVQFGGFTRVKNFTAVTSPATGVYCLTPSVGIDIHATVQIVTVEWGESSGSDLLAFIDDTGGSSCAASQIEVLTFKGFSPGPPAPSDFVAFQVVLP